MHGALITLLFSPLSPYEAKVIGANCWYIENRCVVTVGPAMPARLPDHVQRTLHTMFFETESSVALITKRLNIHRTTIYRLRVCWELYGEPYLPSKAKKGRPLILTGEQLSAVLAKLDERPGLP